MASCIGTRLQIAADRLTQIEQEISQGSSTNHQRCLEELSQEIDQIGNLICNTQSLKDLSKYHQLQSLYSHLLQRVQPFPGEKNDLPAQAGSVNAKKNKVDSATTLPIYKRPVPAACYPRVLQITQKCDAYETEVRRCQQILQRLRTFPTATDMNQFESSIFALKSHFEPRLETDYDENINGMVTFKKENCSHLFTHFRAFKDLLDGYHAIPKKNDIIAWSQRVPTSDEVKAQLHKENVPAESNPFRFVARRICQLFEEKQPIDVHKFPPAKENTTSFSCPSTSSSAEEREKSEFYTQLTFTRFNAALAAQNYLKIHHIGGN